MVKKARGGKIPEMDENFHLGYVIKPECILETIDDFETKHKIGK